MDDYEYELLGMSREEMEMKARILLYDLETSPNLGYFYGSYKVYPLKYEEYSRVMSISWRWYGESKIHHKSLVDHTEVELAGVIHELFDQADVVVAHNAYGFDNKVASAEFIKHELPPPSPYKTVDTLRIARSQFKFPGGNRLDELGRYLNMGTKTSTTVKDLWYDCLVNNTRSAWTNLRKYNNQDIVLLQSVYEAMLPHVKNHPNLGDILQRDGVCPKCGSKDLQKRGWNNRRNGRTQRYQCNGCFGWTNEAKLNKKGRLVNA